jgi:hypothetical protein
MVDIIVVALMSGKPISVVKRYLHMKYRMDVSKQVLINRKKALNKTKTK